MLSTLVLQQQVYCAGFLRVYLTLVCHTVTAIDITCRLSLCWRHLTSLVALLTSPDVTCRSACWISCFMALLLFAFLLPVAPASSGCPCQPWLPELLLDNSTLLLVTLLLSHSSSFLLLLFFFVLRTLSSHWAILLSHSLSFLLSFYFLELLDSSGSASPVS